MFSIIVCSIDPQAAARLHQNITETIGVPFEYIAFDNRNTGRGICNVYNECARKAKYDLLCFVHEDVLFRTPGWGRIIGEKLREETCGVVGFAGGIVKTRELTSWCLDREDARQNYRTLPCKQGKMKHFYHNPAGVDYAPVICLDGFCQITKRFVWEAAPYDDALFSGFHAYDLDFTTAAACRHQNYVCNTVEVEHYSVGKYSKDWLQWLKIYHEKWKDRLPMFAEDRPSERKIAALERKAEARLIKKLLHEHIFGQRENINLVMNYLRKNLRYGPAWMLVLKLLRYGLHKQQY